MRATISATLTQEAYGIYKEWSKERKASDEISRAMVESFARENLLAAVTTQRDIYRRRSGSIKRLAEEIDAGLYHTPQEILKHIYRIFEKHPFMGEEQSTLEEY